MSKQSKVAYGEVAFSNLLEHEKYMGESTGRYSLTVVLDADSQRELEDAGVKIKDYKGSPQRKFASKFPVPMLDGPEGQEKYSREIPYGSKVKIAWITGDAHPVHGVPAYLNAVRVLEEAEHVETPDDF